MADCHASIAFLCLILSTAVWAGQVGELPCRAVDPALRRPLADVIGVNTHYGTDVDPGVDRLGRDVHLLAADGHDLTPPTLARGALVPSLADGGPIYLVGAHTMRIRLAS